jgi:hypothetical protein
LSTEGVYSRDMGRGDSREGVCFRAHSSPCRAPGAARALRRRVRCAPRLAPHAAGRGQWNLAGSRVLGLGAAMTKSVVLVASGKALPLALVVRPAPRAPRPSAKREYWMTFHSSLHFMMFSISFSFIPSRNVDEILSTRERRAPAPPRRRRLRRAAQQALLGQVVGLLPAAAGDKGLLALCRPAPAPAPRSRPALCALHRAQRPRRCLGHATWRAADARGGGAGPRSGGGRCRL